MLHTSFYSRPNAAMPHSPRATFPVLFPVQAERAPLSIQCSNAVVASKSLNAYLRCVVPHGNVQVDSRGVSVEGVTTMPWHRLFGVLPITGDPYLRLACAVALCQRREFPESGDRLNLGTLVQAVALLRLIDPGAAQHENTIQITFENRCYNLIPVGSGVFEVY